MALPHMVAGSLLCLLLTACRQAPGSATDTKAAAEPSQKADAASDEATVNGTSLQLVDRDGACVLKSGGSEFPLQPKPPCFFLRRGGSVQSFAYRERNVAWTVIVAGTPITDAIRKEWNLKQSEVCGQQSQGVLKQGASLRVSKVVQSGGVYCKDKGVDEKDFYSFAHEQ